MQSTATAASAGAPVSAEQLAAHFVQQDEALKRRSKELAPVRRERKEMHDHLTQLLEASDPSSQSIALPDGTVVSLKASESAAAVKQDYVAQQLEEQLGLATPQALEVARRIWDERPKTTRYKVVYSTSGAPGAAGAAAGAQQAPKQRKRAREQ
jgi:hypothetical protein